MPDFNIDDFKKTWQEHEVRPKYGNSEILEMLNHKSRNYVKYILWISVVEFLFFTGLSVFYIFRTEDSNSFISAMEKLGVHNTPELQQEFGHLYNILKALSFLITGFFVVRFYQNYRRINLEANLKRFILQIMIFRRTVNHFILANILLLIIFTGILTLFIFRTLATQEITLEQPTLVGFLTGIGIATLLSVGLIWLYYRIVYGIIMKKLGRNLNQLKDIENNSEQN
ncbi:beta-carotene 15,15'-monooxygenase [Kaistella sp. PBT33-4]|uniref:beta-carotene 15,15'-monooxygenase n=1 Tax=Kaistella sp. PBT33-4 TaxID=3032000 RepID=UPI0023D8ABA6|nr:beta-carotene 15,15'-monooxygenase [Kaistella sp. PBT33-4]MDF0718740.1 beta-carotene 15,15'-monooxygenase [Kaistella sp. PBT33-4]